MNRRDLLTALGSLPFLSVPAMAFPQRKWAVAEICPELFEDLKDVYLKEGRIPFRVFRVSREYRTSYTGPTVPAFDIKTRFVWFESSELPDDLVGTLVTFEIRLVRPYNGKATISFSKDKRNSNIEITDWKGPIRSFRMVDGKKVFSII